MTEENEQKIREWLAKGGRPLEMRVAGEFWRGAARAHRGGDRWGFELEQSPYFQDSELGKAREIDVVALFSHRAHPDWVVSIPTECKFNAPTFVILLPTKVDELQFRCVSKLARDFLPEKNSDVMVDLNGTPLFEPLVPVGHSILTMPPDSGKDAKPDRGWSAVMGAAKAGDWYATRLDEERSKELHVSFPVVVTDGTLATAELDQQKLEIDVHEVDHARCVLKWPLSSSPATIVDVVTVAAFPAFARGAADAASKIIGHWDAGFAPQ